MTDTLLINAAAIAAMMLVLWIVSLMLRDASIVDLFWGLGFVLVAWVTFFSAEPSNRHVLLPALVALWGVRLSTYLAWRNHGRPEDARYRAMRERHGRRFPLVSLVTVFGFQALIMWVVSLPLQLAHRNDVDRPWFLMAGTVLWTVGLLFESVGDWQLARFKQDPQNAGRVMNQGLWRYSRHPNYFGDFCVWWGLFLVALGCGGPWWTAIGPAVMTLFLMRISGVTLLEDSLKPNKPAYAEYIATTNAFFPWLPRDPLHQGD